MNKDDLFLTIFLYLLVVLISFSRPFWGQISSAGWVQALAVQLQKPVLPEGESIQVTPIWVMTKSVHLAKAAQKRIRKPRKGLLLPLNGITTVKKNSNQEENAKG